MRVDLEEGTVLYKIRNESVVSFVTIDKIKDTHSFSECGKKFNTIQSKNGVVREFDGNHYDDYYLIANSGLTDEYEKGQLRRFIDRASLKKLSKNTLKKIVKIIKQG